MERMMIYRFSNERTARRFATRCNKAMAIVLGDDETFWVVTLAQMENLIRQGYEAV